MCDGWAVLKRNRCPKATLIHQKDDLEISSEVERIFAKYKVLGSTPEFLAKSSLENCKNQKWLPPTQQKHTYSSEIWRLV